jgi:hypothetical protein
VWAAVLVILVAGEVPLTQWQPRLPAPNRVSPTLGLVTRTRVFNSRDSSADGLVMPGRGAWDPAGKTRHTVTKDRARKQDIRARMAASGEPYSVAARHLAGPGAAEPPIEASRVQGWAGNGSNALKTSNQSRKQRTDSYRPYAAAPFTGYQERLPVHYAAFGRPFMRHATQEASPEMYNAFYNGSTKTPYPA